MQAAIGAAQLSKLKDFVSKRGENWACLREQLAPLEQYLILPEREPNANPSWFGFLITVRENSPVSREDLVAYLGAHNIQTRPLFAGNLTRHPCFQLLEEGRDYRIAASLSITDQIMNHSFWLGVYPGMEQSMLNEIIFRIQKCFLYSN